MTSDERCRSFDEVYETIPGTGWLTRPEADLLWRVSGRLPGRIIEVGAYHGRSTVLLAAHGRPVIAIDPFSGFDSDDPTGESTYEKFVSNLLCRGIRNVELIRRRVEDVSATPGAGFAYLDGDHTYEGTMAQIGFACACGAEEVCIHDFVDSGGGAEVVRAARDWRLEVVEVVERMAHCRIGP